MVKHIAISNVKVQTMDMLGSVADAGLLEPAEEPRCLCIAERSVGKPVLSLIAEDAPNPEAALGRLVYHLPSMVLEPLVEGVCVESPLGAELRGIMNKIHIPASSPSVKHYIYLRTGDAINFSQHGIKLQLVQQGDVVAIPITLSPTTEVVSSLPVATPIDNEPSDTEDEDDDDLDKASFSTTAQKAVVAATPATSVLTAPQEGAVGSRPGTADPPFSTAPAAPVLSSMPEADHDSPSVQAAESQGAKSRRVAAESQARHGGDLYDAVEATPTSDADNSFPHRARGRLNGTTEPVADPFEQSMIEESPQKKPKAKQGYNRSNRTFVREEARSDNEQHAAEAMDKDHESNRSIDSADSDESSTAVAVGRDGSVQREQSITNVPTSEPYGEAEVFRATSSRSLKRQHGSRGLQVSESPEPKRHKANAAGNTANERSEELGSDGEDDGHLAKPSNLPDTDDDADVSAPVGQGRAMADAADDDMEENPVMIPKKRAGALSKPSKNARKGQKTALRSKPKSSPAPAPSSTPASNATGDKIAVAPNGAGRTKSSPHVRVTSTVAKPKALREPTSSPALVGKTPKVILSGIELPAKTLQWLKDQGVEIIDKIPGKKTHFLCMVSKGGLKNTAKVLRTLTHGKLVVTDQWAIDSLSANSLLEPGDYVPDELAGTMDADRSKLFKNSRLFFTAATHKGYGKDGWKSIEALAKDAGAKSVEHGDAKKGISKGGHVQRIADNTIFIGMGDEDKDAALLRDEHDRTVYHKDLLTQSILRGVLDLDSAEFKLELATATAVKGRKGKAKAK